MLADGDSRAFPESTERCPRRHFPPGESHFRSIVSCRFWIVIVFADVDSVNVLAGQELNGPSTRRPVSGASSHWRDCHFADALSPSPLKTY